MLKLIRHPRTPDIAAALFVWVVGVLVGRQAAIGMDQQQWLAAAASICGAILVAVMVRTRASGAPANAQTRRER